MTRHLYIYRMVNYEDVPRAQMASAILLRIQIPAGFGSTKEGCYLTGPSAYNRSQQNITRTSSVLIRVII
jgi:hypothetical protein